MPPIKDNSYSDEAALAYHVLRYTSNLVRDEWVNIGVLLFDPVAATLRLRLIEDQDEFSRVRRLKPMKKSSASCAIIWKTASRPFCTTSDASGRIRFFQAKFFRN